VNPISLVNTTNNKNKRFLFLKNKTSFYRTFLRLFTGGSGLSSGIVYLLRSEFVIVISSFDYVGALFASIPNSI
jgi:hypothetical protein